MGKTYNYLQAHSLRELIEQLNEFNNNNPNNPISKEDIVNIFHEEGIYILLYYK